jgi:hypothetical protein
MIQAVKRNVSVDENINSAFEGGKRTSDKYEVIETFTYAIYLAGKVTLWRCIAVA